MSDELLPDGSLDSSVHRATIASTAIAVPPHVLSRDLVKQYFGPTFSLSGRRLDAVLEVVENAKIDRRYFILPIDELIEPRSLSETSRLYREHALKLGRCVAQRALDRAGLAPADVDMIVSVSCTGFMIPSVWMPILRRNGFSRRRAPPADYRAGLRRGRSGIDAGLGISPRLSTRPPCC